MEASCKGAKWWDGMTVRTKLAILIEIVVINRLIVPVIGVETHGANCFYESIALNHGPFSTSQSASPSPDVEVIQDPVYGVALARLSKLTSRASDSLGAAMASAGCVKMALERKGGIKCVCVSDEQTMHAAVSFAGVTSFVPLFFKTSG